MVDPTEREGDAATTELRCKQTQGPTAAVALKITRDDEASPHLILFVLLHVRRMAAPGDGSPVPLSSAATCEFRASPLVQPSGEGATETRPQSLVGGMTYGRERTGCRRQKTRFRRKFWAKSSVHSADTVVCCQNSRCERRECEMGAKRMPPDRDCLHSMSLLTLLPPVVPL